MQEGEKRLFFGMQVKAPWPETFPAGRLLDEHHRHLTLAFLGKTELSKIHEALNSFPQPPFKLGFAAKFDQCLFLPPRHPHVVAWHVKVLEERSRLDAYYAVFIHWLQEKGFAPDTRHGFMPHVTLARSPFQQKPWEKAFSPLPAIIQDIHLFESVGNLHYESLWSYPLLPPFEEFEHTADIAYRVYGEGFNQLFQHASLALCFNFPLLLDFLITRDDFKNLDDVIIALNELVHRADSKIGCPFKAVSFHSHLEEKENILKWEMIVDV